MACGCSSGGNGGLATAPAPTVDKPAVLLERTEDVLKTPELSDVGNGQGQRYVEARAGEFTSSTQSLGAVEAESLFGAAVCCFCRFARLGLLILGAYLLYRIFSRGGKSHVAANSGLS